MLSLHRRCVGCSQKMMFRGIRPAGQRVPGRQARDNNHDTCFLWRALPRVWLSGIKRHTKKLTLTWWKEIKSTVSGPALCPCEEPPLDDSPSVVAGSSADCDCTPCRETERDSIWCTAYSRLRSQPSAPIGAYPLGPRRDQGRLRTSRRASRRTRRKRVPVRPPYHCVKNKSVQVHQ